ncbi:MAG: redoxin domain-containing protein [Phycisphaerales bacterium JB043]
MLTAVTGGALVIASTQPGDQEEPAVDRTTPVETTAVVGMRLPDVDGNILRVGGDSASKASVIVLLDTGCPIATRYAPELNTLHERAIEADIVFYGVISDPMATPSEARAFRDDRELSYPVLFDATGDLALALEPTTVPQAFVIGVHGEVLYSGRIDNRFASVGRMRQKVTSHDLLEAIDAVASGKPVENARTEPTGCVFEAWDSDLPDEVTYTQHIQPIIAANCMECHVDGGIAPFSFESYSDTARRAAMISYVTRERIMPPWPGDPEYRRFRGERTLTDRQIELIRAWTETGKQRGDDAHALAVPERTTDWPLGEPDAIVTMEEPYKLPATGVDQYRRFVMKSPFDEPTTITAISFKPGDPGVVHHANIFYDGTGEARQRAALDEGPGYDAFGDKGGMQATYEWETEGFGIGGWAPGARGYQLPDGVGLLLPAGGDIMVEVHYHLNGVATSDQSSIAFYTAKEPVERYTDGLLMGSLDVSIKAGDASYKRHIYMDVPVDMELIDMFPHMHYLGTRVKAEATTPDGATIPLLKIDDWDFRWQALYQFPEPVRIPAGSRIDAWFSYDNSADNPGNPHDPPVDIKWGWQSSDEMLEIWMTTIYTGASDSLKLQEAALTSFYRKAAPK